MRHSYQYQNKTESLLKTKTDTKQWTFPSRDLLRLPPSERALIASATWELCHPRDSQDRLRPQPCSCTSLSSSSPRPPLPPPLPPPPRLRPPTSSSTCARTAPWPPPRLRSSAGLSLRRPPPHPLEPSSSIVVIPKTPMNFLHFFNCHTFLLFCFLFSICTPGRPSAHPQASLPLVVPAMTKDPIVLSTAYGIATAAVIAAALPAPFAAPGRGPSERYGMTVFSSKV